MSEVVVYTSPTCQPCKAVKRWLNENGIKYKEKGPDEAVAAGYKSVPVIIYGDNVISGFNPVKMKELFL